MMAIDISNIEALPNIEIRNYTNRLYDYKKIYDEIEHIVNDMKYDPYKASCIYFIEYNHVFTAGSSIKYIENTADNIPIIKTDRGGKITYHGPGQLVCYPILRLSDFGMTSGQYTRFLHAWITNALFNCNIMTSNTDDSTGVWIRDTHNNDLKVGFIGVSISSGITKHGFSLNLHTCLDKFYKVPICSMGYTKMIGNLHLNFTTIINALLSNLKLRCTILHANTK